MKNKGFLIIPALIAAISAPDFVSARENVNSGSGKISQPPPSINASCSEATAQSDLAVNNVRCRILMGDMWWDLTNGLYIIPKAGTIGSIFAGSLWIGGIDIGGQLKVAAQTYRQTGNDFWPGPLDTTSASTELNNCVKYDKHFRITRKEVETFVASGTITSGITNWPGNGDVSKGQAQYLAPFFDKDGDGIYNSSAGDYPGYDLVAGDNYGDCREVNCTPVDQLFGDETLWWVFNDEGNIHSETGGKAIGLEIRAQAFGFFTDDEINDMTFYNYRVFNRSTYEVDSCYFGVWCDADLGNYNDDFVGCDVKRGLGFTYNGDNDDEVGSAGYGANPPAIGIDYFRGPLADQYKADGVTPEGKDNNRNCQIDEPCEQAIMSGFMYYNNTNGVPNGNPSGATHFYNYLKMKWGDGTDVKYGGDGYSSSGPVCNFMFPGSPTSDEHDWGIGGNCSTTPSLLGWDENTAGNTPADRRMLLSAGPFTLKPGALNVITTGVVWARASSGGAQASVTKLRIVDDKAQALFDNCFKVLDGPNAPDVTIQEMDKELILYLSNTDPTSNNFNETYQEFDPLIALQDTGGNKVKVDTTYNFEGYKIYQLKKSTVTANDLDNPDLARLIGQCDVKNGVSRIINYEFDQSLGAGVPKEKVNGGDVGIAHTFKVTSDAFSSGASTLINQKTYYFMVVAYGYNEFKKYQPDTPPGDNPFTPAYNGQKKPYKQGRKNIYPYAAIPHIPTPETGGTVANSEYGTNPSITRIEGTGNGGLQLEYTSATVSAILASADSRYKTPSYVAGYGPVNVKVIDPLNVPEGNAFTLKFDTVPLIVYTGNVGAFQVGETISTSVLPTPGKPSAVVVDNNGKRMHIKDIANGPFLVNDSIIGSTSSAYAKVERYSNPGRNITNSNWILTNNTTGEKVWSDQTIQAVNEQLFMNWGLSISIEQVIDPGLAGSINNGFIGASMTFSDPSKKWLSGVADQDGPYYENWIRSGTITGSDAFQNDYTTVDDKQVYEAVIGATWAPYRLTACTDALMTAGYDGTKFYGGPGFKASFMNQPQMKDLASVDIVLTSDKSLWTRAAVIEMSEDTNYSLNTSGAAKKARKLDYRRSPSVDKNGVANYPSADNNDFADGMGWFPGYAINLETGERLNIAFGENSALNANGGALVRDTISGTFQVGELVTGGTSGATGTILSNSGSSNGATMNLKTVSGTFKVAETITGGTSGALGKVVKYTSFDQNGADMKWNPTAKTTGVVPWVAGATGPVFGGQHYIYVFGHNKDNTPPPPPLVTPLDSINVPRYDRGYRIRQILSWDNGQPADAKKRELYRDAMWVSIPLLQSGQSLLSSDVTIRLRVGKSYKPGYSPAYYTNGTASVYTDTASTAFGQNYNLPMYTFSTEGLSTTINDHDLAVSALDLIKVVPNPYYAFSAYENGTLDNRVKITNLPETCTISIYNLSGTLIRKFVKGEPSTNHTPKGLSDPASWHNESLDWDLKNTATIPISSGIYIFHVEVPGVGEKVVKWFGIMRPIDLDSF